MAEALRRVLLVAALLGALAAGACADQSKKRDDALRDLLAWLPGSYDNADQAASDPLQGVRPPHSRVAVSFMKVYAPRLGHHVLYVQESAADDPLRVMSQHMYSTKSDDKRGVLTTVYSFANPLRWRSGQESPDMFTGVTTEDVRSVPGCELVWTKSGEQLRAARDPKLCREAPGPSGGPATAELTADALTLEDYRFKKRH
jgi:CpeT/CpcT family protein DUF1001